MIYGDARELEVALQTQFPHSSIRVYRYSESLVLTGFVDRPDHVSPIMRLAEDYAPKVINNITVGGVQQILLKVKVMEVSRTKLRELGVDWACARRQRRLRRHRASADLLSDDVRRRRRRHQSVTIQPVKRSSSASFDGNDAFFGVPRRPAAKPQSPRFWPSRTSSPSAAGRPSSTSAASSRSWCRKAWAPPASSSSHSARRSTSCRSCWATAISASKCDRGSATSIRRSQCRT